MLSSVRFVDLGVDSKHFEASGTVKPCIKQCSVLRGELGLVRSTRAKHILIFITLKTRLNDGTCAMGSAFFCSTTSFDQ